MTQRPIKFRAFLREWPLDEQPMKYRVIQADEEGRTWLIALDEGDDSFDGNFERGKDVEVMQFTGLYDKNGKEIWEGDIIQTEDDGQLIEPVVVFWGLDQWLIRAKALDMRVTDWSVYAVIGNIYEKPELLKL